MRKNLQRLMLCALMAIASLFAVSQNPILLSESFEGEGIPAGWTQDYITGAHSWVVEGGDGLSYPSGAYEGSKRVALRNITGTTIGYKTKLVTPVLATNTLRQPIVRFAYAQDQRSGDVDVLKVYYRTDTTLGWTILETFDVSTPMWTTVDLFLTGASKNYQLAFEGADRMGRGIVIDDVIVRSAPNCNLPSYVDFLDLTTNSASISWEADYSDALQYHIRVNQGAIENIDETKGNIVDTILTNDYTFELALTNILSQGENYFVYFRTICAQGEQSAWSEAFTFRTRTLVDIPYLEDFNMPANPGFVGRPASWTFGSSDLISKPYVNVGMLDQDPDVLSEDATFALCFTGSETWNTTQPAKSYAYAASPLLNISDISLLKVEFSAVYDLDYAENNSITVGVMTDPQDYSTFTPVKTVGVSRISDFQHFIVPLNTYSGSAKYVALVSEFDEGTNMIFIDNVLIDSIGTCPVPADLKVYQNTHSEAILSWETGGVTSFDVIAAPYDVVNGMNPNSIDASYLVEGVAMPYTIQNIDAWSHLCVYVRSKNATETSEWSRLLEFRTPDVMSIMPYTVPEQQDYSPINSTNYNSSKLPNGVLALWNTEPEEHPEYKTSWSGNSLYLTTAEKNNRYAMMIFPEITDVSNTKVEFSAKPSDQYNVSDRFVVGMIKNVHDHTSFFPIDTLFLLDDWKKYRVRLETYTGSANFFAIKVYTNTENSKTSYLNLKNIVFDAATPCKDPKSIKCNTTPTSATISWNANGGDMWEVVLSSAIVSVDYNGNESVEKGAEIFRDTVTSPSVTFSNLAPNRTLYSYTIRNLCSGGTILGDWLPDEGFYTDCYPENPVPFNMDFDNLVARLSDFSVVPCWSIITPTHNSTTGIINDNTYNPYSETLQKPIAHSGENAHLLRTTDGANGTWNTGLVLPPMQGNITDYQVKFWMKSGDNVSKLEVGIITIPDDTTTMTTIRSVKSYAPNTYQEFIVPLDKYTGTGKYIILLAGPLQEAQFAIDNITVEPISPCPKVMLVNTDYKADSTSATISWTPGYEETAWDVVVSTSEITSSLADDAMNGTTVEGVAFSGLANSNPFTVTGLSDNTHYYFYVRANCGGTKGEWSSMVGEFRTTCGSRTIETLAVENFEIPGENGVSPSCWVVGNEGATTAGGDIPTFSTEYAHSGVNSFKLSSTTKYNGAYAISPLIRVSDISDMQVSLWASAGDNVGGDYESKLIVGIVTNPFDLSTVVPVDTLNLFADEQYYIVQFDKYIGDAVDGSKGRHVFFYSSFTKNNVAYIDDVEYSLIPDCQWPTGLEVDEIFYDSVHLSWNIGTPNYTIIISTEQLSTEELQSGTSSSIVSKVENINDPSVGIAGLESNTSYFAYVAGRCASGNDAWSTPVRFQTVCPPSYAIPFVEDFNSIADVGAGAGIAPCWTGYFSNLNDAGKYPFIAENKKMVIFTADGGAGQSYAATPGLEGNIAGYKVSFKADGKTVNTDYYGNILLDNNGWSESSVIVGVSSDVSTGEQLVATFVPVDTILLPEKDEETSYEVSLASYTGTGTHVVFTCDYSVLDPTGYFYRGPAVTIDDVLVGPVPTCLSPEQVAVTNFSATYADINIIGGDDAASWEVKYGPDGFNPEAEGSLQTTASRSCRINSLSMATTYDIYVRTVCDANDKSMWTSASLTTLAVEPINAQVGYGDGYEDATKDADWTLLNGIENTWTIGSAKAKDGVRALYISNDGGNTATFNNNTEAYSWAILPIKLLPGQYTFSYDWTCVGDYENMGWMVIAGAYMRTGLIPASATINQGTNTITQADGTLGSLGFGYYATPVPPEWISLDGVDEYGMARTGLHSNPDWLNSSTTIVVEEEKIYNVAIFWYNTNTESNISPAIDNFIIDYSPCVKPINVEVSDITGEGANITWTSIGGATKWQVQARDMNDSICFSSSVEGSAAAAISGLVSSTQYEVLVRAICGNDTTAWSESALFTTACPKFPVGAMFGFEESEGSYYYYGTNKTLICTEVKNINDVYESYYLPTIAVNEANYSSLEVVARTGSGAFYMMNNQENNKGSFLALPEFDVEDIQTVRVSFWMRPGYHSIPSDGSAPTFDPYYAATEWARQISVGVMDDLNDYSSYKEVEVCTWTHDPYISSYEEGKLLTEDPTGNNFWVKYTVDITQPGKNIVFMSNPNGYAKNCVYIDDVEVLLIPDCATPSNITILPKDTEVEIAFNTNGTGASWEYMISESASFDGAVAVPATDSVINVTGLNPLTTYFVQLRTNCANGDNSDWTFPISVETVNAMKYTENFSTQQRVQDGWTRASFGSNVEDIFAGTKLPLIHDGLDGWERSIANIYSDGHSLIENVGNHTEWLISPAVYIGEDYENVALTFDLALTDQGTSAAPSPEDFSGIDGAFDGAQFMVIVSEDAGETWIRANATIWDQIPGSGNYEYNKIAYDGELVTINLNKYVGKNIKVGFYSSYYGTHLNEMMSVDLHLDNVNINYMVDSILSDNVCEYESYFDNGFSILADELEVGNNEFSRTVLNKTNNPDTSFNLQLMVDPILEGTVIEATLCDGEYYTEHGFNVNTGGTYKHKLASANGCDSIVTLFVSAVERSYYERFDTICQGQEVEMNGKYYGRTGIYRDTTVSSVGCDSVMTLYLKVSDQITANEMIKLCAGETYMFADSLISTTGIYVKTLKTQQGCDSLVTLDITVFPVYDTTIYASICPGEVYTDDDYFSAGISKEGTYPITGESSYGCDSTVTLVLSVLKGDTSYVYHTITTRDLPYTYDDGNGNRGTTFKPTTPPGVYSDTIHVASEGCEGVIILTLTIDEYVSTDNVDYTTFSIIPNPINVGESVTVEINSNETIVACMIYNYSAELVNSFTPNANPIVLDDFNTPGVYLVRVITDSGKVFVGKVMVK